MAPGGRSGPGWPAVAVLCLGVWLHAADSLLAATVMPSAVAEIGGIAFIYWTVAIYELGSIVAGAITGILAIRLGLRAAMMVAALIYGAGCTVSAIAPDMAAMLLGRLLQGLGGGWMMALSHVGVTQLFPAPRWPELLAVISGVWGVSALTGPLIGGAFATAGLWRGAFWAFAVQALALAALMPMLLERTSGTVRRAESVPWGRITVLSAGVVAVLTAGVQASSLAALTLVGLGLLLLATALALERRRNQLFPPDPLNLRRPWGAGYAMVLALSIATVSFTVYGPLLMETLYGVTPLVAGFMIAIESVSWTIAAIVFAGAGAHLEPALIRGGPAAITIGIAGLAWTMPLGPVAALVPWVVLLGAGFGMCWAFVMRRVVESVAESERERAASSLPTIQLLGYALGAALSGIVANLYGLAADAPRGVVETAAFWVFAAFLPLASAGVAAAWRLSRGTGSGS
ncbi:MAG TPA: MFS transporter [Geminicoccaceae bacterium]|nr:MFS transporter [Geminicoccaceae bacterium]